MKKLLFSLLWLLPTLTWAGAPTVTTNAATNITATSAKLNGSVTSSDANASVDFDFGYNDAYGFTIAATPAQVYSSTPVPVISSKTDLESCTEYHYRVTATNSSGTSYGADSVFKTSCSHVPNSWLFEPSPIVLLYHDFTLAVHVDSHGVKVGAYLFTVTFDPTKMVLDTAYQDASGTCIQGVCPGTSALANRVNTVNNTTGTLTLAGSDAVGIGPSSSYLQLLVIHFIARNVPGIFLVDLTTTNLATTSGDIIGLVARGANVAVSPGLCGDSDGNGIVNVVDALGIARKLAGLPPPPPINTNLADVDQNARVSIGDALHITRYYVGLLIGAINACAIGQPL